MRVIQLWHELRATCLREDDVAVIDYTGARSMGDGIAESHVERRPLLLQTLCPELHVFEVDRHDRAGNGIRLQ